MPIIRKDPRATPFRGCESLWIDLVTPKQRGSWHFRTRRKTRHCMIKCTHTPCLATVLVWLIAMLVRSKQLKWQQQRPSYLWRSRIIQQASCFMTNVYSPVRTLKQDREHWWHASFWLSHTVLAYSYPTRGSLVSWGRIESLTHSTIPFGELTSLTFLRRLRAFSTVTVLRELFQNAY